MTSVGGTSLAIGKHENYEGETAWGTFLNPLTVSSTGQSSWAFTPGDTVDELTNGLYDGSTGGGVAYAYAQPWYQRGVVPTSLADDLGHQHAGHLQHRDQPPTGPSRWPTTRA